MKLLLTSIFLVFTAIALNQYNLATRLASLSPFLHFQNLTKVNSPPKSPFTPLSSFSTTTSKNMTVPRKIHQTFLATEQAEGAGARVRRSIGTPKLRQFSPFLMLDHFTVAPGAGFPDHPHRGQETITYLLSGAVDHEDFAGHAGTIHAGDLQFMTAGRGIMHAEMPNQGFKDNVGMQLWVDLPAKLKKCEPRYRDLRAAEIPTVTADDGKVTIKVISGQSQGTDSVQELAYTPVWLLDVTIKPGGKVTQPLPKGWNAFAYGLDGTVTFGAGTDRIVAPKYHNTVFEQEGDEVIAEVDADATEDGRFSMLLPFILDLQSIAETNGSSSSCRRAAARSKGRAVRTVRAELAAGGLPGPDGLPDAVEWVRAGGRMEERDWKDHGPLGR